MIHSENAVSGQFVCGVVWLTALFSSTSGCGNANAIQDGVLTLPMLSGATCRRPPNGCGPAGILGDIVPECPLPSACFTNACSAHDLCYRACGIGKQACDVQFSMDMESVCSSRFEQGTPQFDQCNTFAFIYRGAVDLFANEAYLFTQLLGCACEPQASRGLQAGRTSARTEVRGSTHDAYLDGAPFEDMDGDLAPDAWEQAVGLDPDDPTDALKDFDGDGVSNLVEFLYSADPFDPTTP